MIKLTQLEYRYPQKYNDIFEDIATLIFCTDLSLPRGVTRRIDQEAVESDPVTIAGRTYAYQAKYYGPATRLYDRKKDLMASIVGAAGLHVTDLYLFLNKDKPPLKKDGREPDYIRELNETAAAHGIRLHWWFQDTIVTTLALPKFNYIERQFFSPEGSGSTVAAFYEEAAQIIEDCPTGSVFGDISLKDGYMKPYIAVEGVPRDVEAFLEEWVASDESLIFIYGEPGHGKTSLGWKAMYDYCRNGWLAGRVDNVFTFSLNPVNTKILENHSFSLTSLLRWGFERKNEVTPGDCRNALIFLDAYDELLECAGNIDLSSFVKSVLEFSRRTGAHIVVTSRTMAISSHLKEGQLDCSQGPIRAYELQPLTNHAQREWLDVYAAHYSFSDEKEIQDWQRYRHNLEGSILFNEFKALLGIPIIFRMIVTARYLPVTNAGITKVYDDLFELTWERHDRPIDGSGGRKKDVQAALMRHALTLYDTLEETAVPDSNLNSSWLFSFYTKVEKRGEGRNAGTKRVGFLHRSFYHYFLAKEVISWFERYSADFKSDVFAENLSRLGIAELNEAVLSYLEELFARRTSDEKEALAPAFAEAYRILKKTDGFLSSSTGRQINQETYVGPLALAGNVYWNVISVCGLCGHPVTKDNISNYALRIHDMRSAKMCGASLPKAGLYHADFQSADLRGADFTEAFLGNANMSFANLENAKLRGAFLKGAQCFQSNLSLSDCTDAWFYQSNLENCNCNSSIMAGACLEYSNLVSADFTNCNLSKASLVAAYMLEADLTLANLAGARLNYADLSRATLTLAKLNSADLMHANITSANLRNADLTNADLRSADLSGSSLNGAILHKADLIGAILRDTDVSGVDMTYAQLINTDLRGVRLFRTKLDHAYINWSNAQYLKQRGCDISKMNIVMLWSVKSIEEPAFSEYISADGKPKVRVTLVSENGEERQESVDKDYLREYDITEGSPWPKGKMPDLKG